MIAVQTRSLSWDISQREFFLSFMQVLGASLFLACCAQISIPLYFTPVPLSGQTFGVMMIGALLGRRKGLLSVLAYLAEGGFGMPVFAGGSCGVSALMGPTGGYLLGFLVQAYLVGWFIERQTVFHGARIVAALWLFGLIELGLGTLWLAGFVGGAAALAMGCYPFLFGDALKAIAVATYIRRRLPAAA